MIAKDPVTPMTVAKLSKTTSKTIEITHNSYQQFFVYKICTPMEKEKSGVVGFSGDISIMGGVQIIATSLSKTGFIAICGLLCMLRGFFN